MPWKEQNDAKYRQQLTYWCNVKVVCPFTFSIARGRHRKYYIWIIVCQELLHRPLICLTFSVDRHKAAHLRFLSPQPDMHLSTLPDHEHEASASRGVPVYVPTFTGRPAPNHEGMARLSWPEWLVTYQDGLVFTTTTTITTTTTQCLLLTFISGKSKRHTQAGV